MSLLSKTLLPVWGLLLAATFISPVASAIPPLDLLAPQNVTIKNDHPLIFYHGRWDSSPGTWWPASGFKVNVLNLKSLTLNLGPLTPYPFTNLGLSIDGSDFVIINGSAGSNSISIPPAVLKKPKLSPTTIRINAAGWQTYRMEFESLTLNSDAVVVPYIPARTVFQFIGDSFTSGYVLPNGADQSYAFLVGEKYKAEHRITAQAGAALTDIYSYGNVHGMSFEFFKTEDTSYYYTSDHNYTTNWNFARDQPKATHVVIHIGANDNAQGVTGDTFVQVYSDFLVEIRKLYPYQPFFLFTPWGWPVAEGVVYYYYPDQYQQVLDARQVSTSESSATKRYTDPNVCFKSRKALGDNNVFLVNTTGWVTYDDVFPDSLHPTAAGQAKIANNFISYLENWGFSPPK